MKVYRISAQNAQVEKSRALKRSAYMTAAALMVGFFVGGRGLLQEHDPRVLLVLAGLGAGLVALVVWLSLRRTSRFLADAYSSFEITADEQAWTKKQTNTPDVTLARSEVRRVEELQGKGFRICSSDRNRNIWVPCELEGYEELKAEVGALPGVEITSKAAAWTKTYVATAGFLLLFAVALLASDKRIAAGASLVVGAYLVGIFFRHYWNPNLTTRGKRQLMWSALIGVGMLVRAVVVWRG